MNKEISIHCKGNRYLKYSELKAFQGNLKEMSKENYQKLKALILKHGLIAPIFVWNQKEILDGHGRLLVLKELFKEGYSIADIPIVDIDAKTRKEAAEILLSINSHFQTIKGEGLYEFMHNFELDFDTMKDYTLPDIDLSHFEASFFEKKEEIEYQSEFKNFSPFEVEEKIKQEIDIAEKIIFQFSGGKDSSYTMIKILPYLDLRKTEAVYVDTGAEFPDLIVHVMKFCKTIGINLTILKSPKNWHEIYGTKKKFPDVIFRDCIDPLINHPINKYGDTFGKNVLYIRGGMKSQKISRSARKGKSDILQMIAGKYKILNPIYYIDQEKMKEEIQKIPLWPGYAKGFQRTCCWTCPFQKIEHWEAMKKYYPMLWEKMREMALTYDFKYYKGDGFVPRFKKYWGETL